MEDQYYIKYIDAYAKIEDKTDKRSLLYQQFINKFKDNTKVIQFGVINEKVSPNWISIDLYDTRPVIDYNWDIMKLPIADDTFDGIVCNAILEHVPYPHQAITEMYRILKKQGEIWIEVPLNQPYQPSPKDYWRVTPSGIDIWLEKFTKIDSGIFYINKSYIYNGIFFYGRK